MDTNVVFKDGRWYNPIWHPIRFQEGSFYTNDIEEHFEFPKEFLN